MKIRFLATSCDDIFLTSRHNDRTMIGQVDINNWQDNKKIWQVDIINWQDNKKIWQVDVIFRQVMTEICHHREPLILKYIRIHKVDENMKTMCIGFVTIKYMWIQNYFSSIRLKGADKKQRNKSACMPGNCL